MRQLLKQRIAVLPLSVVYKATDEFAGRASILLKDIDARLWEIQVLIAKEYWGKRLGREVFQLLMSAAYDELRARCIVAVVDPNNAASIALVDALGFERVGTRRSGRWDAGHLVYEHRSK
jgi:RimJ/RimL family protein N-acetyltransferase